MRRRHTIEHPLLKTVAQGNRQGVGGIGLRRCREVEQHAHHVLHLPLVGAALTDHGLLDFARRVLRHRQSLRHGGADGGTARLAEFQCGVGVAVHEDVFDGQLLRPEHVDQLAELGEDQAQFGRQRIAADFQATARSRNGRAARRCRSTRNR